MHTPLRFMNNSEALNEGNRRYCSKKLLYTSRSWESAIEDDSYTNSLPLAIFRGHETQITQILILKLLKNFEEAKKCLVQASQKRASTGEKTEILNDKSTTALCSLLTKKNLFFQFFFPAFYTAKNNCFCLHITF